MGMNDWNKTDPIRKRQSKWRTAWQIPLFILSLIALGMANFHKASIKNKPSDKNSVVFEKLNALIKASDLNAAQSACREIIEKTNSDPILQSQAKIYFAEISLLKDESETVVIDWDEALKTLKSIQQENLSEDEKQKYKFLYAKACILLKVELKEALEQLEKANLEADRNPECLNLLSLGYMRSLEPDFIKALKANEEFRNIPLLSEEKRIPAQILGGELLMKLQRPDEARKVLQNINSRKNPSLEIKARQLLALSYMEESLWLESVNIWKQVLDSPKEVLTDAGKPLYFLGVCLKKIDLIKEAEKAWVECEEKSQTDERYAASFQLAQIHFENKNLPLLTNSLEMLVRNCKSEEEWKNKYFSTKQVQNIFEKAQLESISLSNFELSLRINDSLQKVFPLYIALSFRADIFNSWAEVKLKETSEISDSAKIKALKQASTELLVAAANLNVKSSNQAETSLRSSEELWKAITRYRKGKDLPKAQECLLKFINSAGTDNRLGNALYQLGDVQKESGSIDEAKNSYLTSLKYRGPHTYNARYQLALIHIEKNELDQAEETLEQNLQLLRFDPDTDAQEKSLFAIGSIFFQRKNYRMVVRRYEEALERFGKNNQAVRARLQLAEAYRQLANQEQQNFILGEKTTDETKTHYQAEHRKWLQKSAETYQDLEQLADSPLGITQLSEEERLLIPLLAAECKFNMGQYEAAMLIYSRLATKTRGKKEMLHALGGMVRCHSALGQFDLVSQRLAELKSQLNEMDDSVRKEWEPWLAIASKPIQK